MSSAPQESSGSPDRHDAPTYTAMPGWVKWLIVAAVVLGVVLAVALLVGGEHGPGRHMSHGLGTDTVSAAMR